MVRRYERHLEVDQAYRAARHKLAQVLRSSGVIQAYVVSNPSEKTNHFGASLVVVMPSDHSGGALLTPIDFNQIELRYAEEMLDDPDIKGDLLHGVHPYLKSVFARVKEQLTKYRLPFMAAFNYEAVVDTIDISNIKRPDALLTPRGNMPLSLNENPCNLPIASL